MATGPLYLVGYSTRAIATSARRGGYHPFSFDAFGDRDRGPGYTVPLLGRDRHGAWSIVRALHGRPRGTVVWGSPFENAPGCLAEIARLHTVWGPSAATIARVRSWHMFSRAAARSGLKTPITLTGRVPDHGEWLLKPCQSGGGHGIRRGASGMLVPHGWRAQEYLPGTAISLTFLADGQRIIDAFWTRSWATDNDFRYRGGVIDGHLYIPRRQAAEDMAQDLVSTWGLAGWNGLDFLATENALYALELNPRWTGSVELWESVTCQSAFETLVRVMTGSPTTRPARLIPSAGKRIVRAVQRCRWGENWPRIEGGTLADIPWPGQTFQVGQPVCTLVMAGPSAEWVTSHLLAWEEQILTWLHLTSSVSHRGGLP